MSPQTHNALAITAIVVGFVAIAAMVIFAASLGNRPSDVEAAQPHDMRAAFMEGCTGEGATERQCQCMYDGLLGSDTVTWDDADRMSRGDLTEAELDVIVGCA